VKYFYGCHSKVLGQLQRYPLQANSGKNVRKVYIALGCAMSLKVNFLNSHLGYFPENLVAVIEKQGERFHQDIKEMETRYQGRWNVNVMGDYCWLLRRDDTQATYKGKSTKRSFEGKRKRH
jgi:hypothetical protein